MTVPQAFRRGPGHLNVYGGEFRIARAVFDVIAGLDPGAVRLAQTLWGLLPSRGAARRDAEVSRRRESTR